MGGFVSHRIQVVGKLLTYVFHTRAEALIKTGALARCKDPPGTGELFQQFVTSRGKPLKRLTHPSFSVDRAKVPVLTRGCLTTCEISRLSCLLAKIMHSAERS